MYRDNCFCAGGYSCFDPVWIHVVILANIYQNRDCTIVMDGRNCGNHSVGNSNDFITTPNTNGSQGKL